MTTYTDALLVYNNGKTQKISSSDNISLSGDVTIGGDLNVQGDIVSTGATNVLVADAFLDLGAGNLVTASSRAGGFTLNVKASGTAESVTGFTAGVVATSAPSLTMSATSAFAAGDILQVSGASVGANNGLFVVESVSGGTVNLYGIGGTAVPAYALFCQNQVETGTMSATATKVDLAVLTVSDGSSVKDSSGSVIAAGKLARAYYTAAVLSKFNGTGAGTGYTEVSDAVAAASLQSSYEGGNTISLSATEGDLNVSVGSGNAAISLNANKASNFQVTSANLTLGTLSGGAFYLSSANVIEVQAALGLSLESTSGTINLATQSSSGQINIGTNGTRTIAMGSGGATFTLNAGTGGYTLNTASGGPISLNASVGASNFSVNQNNLTLATLISGTIAVTSAGAMDIDAASTLNINSSGGVINIGDDAVNQNIAIGTGGTRTISVGSSNATVNITAGTGRIKLTGADDAVHVVMTDTSGNKANMSFFTSGGFGKPNLTLVQGDESTGVPLGSFIGSGTEEFGMVNGVNLSAAGTKEIGFRLNGSTLAARITSGGAFKSHQNSGSDAIQFATSGARLHLGAGTDDYLVSNGTNISTPGAFAVGAKATASLPSASTVGAGGLVYDSTVGAPLWSNGTAWQTFGSLAAATTLQGAYDASGIPATIQLADTKSFVIAAPLSGTAGFGLNATESSSLSVSSGDLSLETLTSGDINLDAAQAISLDAVSASNFTTTAGNLTLRVNANDSSSRILHLRASNAGAGAAELRAQADNFAQIGAGTASEGPDIYFRASLGNAKASVETSTGGTIDIGVVSSEPTITIGNSTGATAVNIVSGTGGVDVTGTLTGDNYIRTGQFATISLPTGAAGAIVYDSTAGEPLWHNGSSWQTFGSLASASTLQGAYDASSSPATITLAGSKNLVVAQPSTGTAAIVLGANAASSFTVASANLTLATTTSGNLVANVAGGVQLNPAGSSWLSATGGSVTVEALGTGSTLALNGYDGVAIDALSGGTVDINAAGGAIRIGGIANNYAIQLGAAGQRAIAIGNSSGSTTVGITAGGGVTVTGTLTGTSYIKPVAAATGSLPSASSVAGALVYDNTLEQPVWSDGTSWQTFALQAQTYKLNAASASGIVKGNILYIAATSGNAGLADNDNSSANEPVAIAYEAAAGGGGLFRVISAVGMPVMLKFKTGEAPTGTGDIGKVVYLSDSAGEASLVAPSATGSRVYRLGIVKSSTAVSGLYEVVYLPAFIADL